MTPLRQRMTEDMQLRGLAPATQQAYLRYVEQLARFTGKSLLELWLLGPWQAQLNHVPLAPFPSRHVPVLLARLAIEHPSPLSRARLLNDLLPNVNPKSAAQSLRTTLYFLRRALHPDGLACPHGHRLPPNQAPRDRHRAPIMDYRCRTCGSVFNLFTNTLKRACVAGDCAHRSQARFAARFAVLALP